MRAYQTLPENYREYDHVDLQKDKKTALRINIAAAVLFIVLFILGHFAFYPITLLFDTESSMWTYILRWGILLLGYLAYIVLHELTHAAVMKLAGAKKLRFGFTGLYAYAGSEGDWFNKSAYIAVALAPLIVWGIIFTVLLILVSPEWFWVIYFWQVGNITGAAGDVFVTVRFFGMPKDILIRDTGVEMTVYSKEV